MSGEVILIKKIYSLGLAILMCCLPILFTCANSTDAPKGDRTVRIFAELADPSRPNNLAKLVTGTQIPAGSMITILFVDEPCPLEIAGAAYMRRAWQRTGAYQLGCWYPVRNGHWAFVGQISQLDRSNDYYWETLPLALLHSDGSATITEPNYDSDTFSQTVLSRKSHESLAHLNDKP